VVWSHLSNAYTALKGLARCFTI